MPDTNVSQGLLDQPMSQDSLVIDAQMSGILPVTQQTYTDDKGNVYQGDIGQGDGPEMVPVAQTPVIPALPRGGTQYIVSQVIFKY